MQIIAEEFEKVLDKFEKETAVIVYNSNTEVQLITYKHVKDWCKCLTSNIQKYIDKNCSCIGLVMTHNLYIPSLVISLNNCGFPFIFLNCYSGKDNITEIVKRLNIKCIFSTDCSHIQNYVDNFKLVSVIDLSEYGILELWGAECVGRIEKPIEFSNVCYVICTSGTTGKKKYVRVQDFCIWSNIRCFK